MSAFFHLPESIVVLKIMIKNEINGSQMRNIARLISDYKGNRTLASCCGGLMLNNSLG